MSKNNSEVVALGCRLNIFEAEIIKNNMKNQNIDDTIVLNTCTVTQEAHKQSMQMVRKLHKQHPNKKIIVTGCGAEMSPDSFLDMPEVSKVVGNKHKLQSSALTSSERLVYDKLDKETVKEKYEIPKISGFENKTRAFIQIQQGCDHRCSFCIIHQARGASVSVSKQEVVEQIKQVVASGHKEVVLTGVDISSWERDARLKTPSRIGYLCKEILREVPQLQRLRLSSLDPAVQDEDILDLLRTEERFMPHLHLSLQSMNNSVLRNMGRRHSTESAIEWIEKVREANPNTTLGADFICGFPRETKEQSIQTEELVKKYNINFLHVFPYSVRAGTAAAKMQNIPMEERKARAASLIQVGQENKLKLFNSHLGKDVEVLVESRNSGYTKDYCLSTLTNIENLEAVKNTIIKAKVVGISKNSLQCEAIY